MANRLAPPSDVSLQALSDLSKAVDSGVQLPKFGPNTDANVTVEAGQFRHLSPRAAGQNVVIPTASAANFGKRITLYISGALGDLRIRAASGTINGSTSFTLSAGYTTLLELVSNGTNGWATARAAGYPTAGDGLSFSGDTLSVNAGNAMTIVSDAVSYTGSTSTINMSPTAGDLNVVDISTLECGGVYTLQSLTEANIDGFTAKTDGFWFILHVRDATTSESVTMIENSGNTTTSIRTPNTRDWRLTKNDAVMLIYSNSRWRTVGSFPKPWATPTDSVTWAAQQDNFTRAGRGCSHIRVTLTGSQSLTGIVPDGSVPNGELLYLENIDSVDTLTVVHQATSTAANQIICPNSVNLELGPRTGALLRYDDTTSRWRVVSTSALQTTRLISVSRLETNDSSITITPPTGATWFEIECIAGGGGGGGADAETAGETCAGGGGGAGGWFRDIVPIVSGNITGAVGAGGTAGSNAGGNGGTGGTTSYTYNSATRTALGGNGGTGQAAGPNATSQAFFTAAGTGGVPDGADESAVGGDGHPGFMFSSGATATQAAARGGNGGDGRYGGGGLGGIVQAAAGSAAGNDGKAPGSGGGGAARIVTATGAATGATGGVGHTGAMYVRFYSGPVPTEAAIT